MMATSGDPKCVLCTVELLAQESYCQLREKGVDALITAGGRKVLNEVTKAFQSQKIIVNHPWLLEQRPRSTINCFYCGCFVDKDKAKKYRNDQMELCHEPQWA